VLDEADWKKAPVEKIDEARQYYGLGKDKVKWKGPADLSGTIRYLWDDKYLYVGVEVTDDIAGGLKEGSSLWSMDGLQFLVDPCRGQDENVGKYDYAMAVGKKGAQAWCSLTADAGAPPGVANDITVAYHRPGDGTGAITYELAIPWYRLAPLKPTAGGDLGLTMILNEDDGQGRKSFMAWFGNAHSKQIDAVADLILQP
jgi:Carbohydrate family 9 binding domain-like